jgi:adenylate kinase
MLNIALFGPPGAGKGTQSEFLIQKYKLYYISTGDILRKEIAKGSELGQQVKNIESGGLAADELIVQILEKTIEENRDAKGFLFDGFPRTYIQAYILEGLMIKLHTSLNCLISLEIDEEESVHRLLIRAKTSGRVDDKESVIRNRLVEYAEKTKPVLQFYKERNIYVPVKGQQSIQEVSETIDAIVQKELHKSLFNVVLFGYPGSGRGSQGKALAKKYGLEYVATGAMLEQEIKKQTAIGQQIKDLYENGQLVPDHIVVQLIEKKIKASKRVKGFIFKGFPRTLVQSYILDGLLKKQESSVSLVINIEVPTLELIKRLDARSKTEYGMPYDNSTAKIVQRLQEHETKTVAVIEKYEQRHGLSRVDGRGSFEEVFERLSVVLEEGMKSSR